MNPSQRWPLSAVQLLASPLVVKNPIEGQDVPLHVSLQSGRLVTEVWLFWQLRISARQ
jgi:hypothetical protein